MKKEKTWLYDIGRITGMWMWLIWFRPKHIYINKKYKIKGGAQLCYNHSSPYDVMFAQMSVLFRRHHIVAIKDVFEKKGNRFILEHLLAIPVDRENFSVESYKKIVRVLQNGGLIDIFPEGTLEKTVDEFLEFKDGPALFALKSNAPLIPIYMKPRKNIFERKRFYIGDPINLSELNIKKDNIHDATIILKTKLEELKEFSKERK